MADAALVCPACGGALACDRALTCDACRRAYEVVDGIPVLVAHLDEHKREQAEYSDDDVSPEWEIERPHGAPDLYRWLLHEKFRRSVAGIELRGASVLVVCGGSGMDAEFLAETGAHVTLSDISVEAARRACERASRHGFDLDVVVADVERLPFRDRSFDVVFVHDGLHHLERPDAGLREMARLARRAVCITEPARAAVTAVAVRLGVAQDVEDAGNRVERLELEQVRRMLEAAGFRIARASRYAMLYRHEPKALMRLFSLPGLLPIAKSGVRVANAAAGPLGNKLVVQGVRS